jgi:hypothetical protein
VICAGWCGKARGAGAVSGVALAAEVGPLAGAAGGAAEPVVAHPAASAPPATSPAPARNAVRRSVVVTRTI